MIVAVSECIRELHEIPNGHLYAQLVGKVSLVEYESLIRILINAKLVKQDRSHMLRWIGPNLETPTSAEKKI
jgi:hypothetical protein